MNSDLISRQAAIDELNDGAELLRRVLDDTDIVGVERAKYEWGLGLIESYISDVEELPSAEPEIIRCKDCKYYELDSLANVNGIPLIVAHHICKRWGNGCKTDKNGFCFMGEKVTE